MADDVAVQLRQLGHDMQHGLSSGLARSFPEWCLRIQSIAARTNLDACFNHLFQHCEHSRYWWSHTLDLLQQRAVHLAGRCLSGSGEEPQPEFIALLQLVTLLPHGLFHQSSDGCMHTDTISVLYDCLRECIDSPPSTPLQQLLDPLGSFMSQLLACPHSWLLLVHHESTITPSLVKDWLLPALSLRTRRPGRNQPPALPPLRSRLAKAWMLRLLRTARDRWADGPWKHQYGVDMFQLAEEVLAACDEQVPAERLQPGRSPSASHQSLFGNSLQQQQQLQVQQPVLGMLPGGMAGLKPLHSVSDDELDSDLSVDEEYERYQVAYQQEEASSKRARHQLDLSDRTDLRHQPMTRSGTHGGHTHKAPGGRTPGLSRADLGGSGVASGGAVDEDATATSPTSAIATAGATATATTIATATDTKGGMNPSAAAGEDEWAEARPDVRLQLGRLSMDEQKIPSLLSQGQHVSSLHARDTLIIPPRLGTGASAPHQVCPAAEPASQHQQPIMTDIVAPRMCMGAAAGALSSRESTEELAAWLADDEDETVAVVAARDFQSAQVQQLCRCQPGVRVLCELDGGRQVALVKLSALLNTTFTTPDTDDDSPRAAPALPTPLPPDEAPAAAMPTQHTGPHDASTARTCGDAAGRPDSEVGAPPPSRGEEESPTQSAEACDAVGASAGGAAVLPGMGVSAALVHQQPQYGQGASGSVGQWYTSGGSSSSSKHGRSGKWAGGRDTAGGAGGRSAGGGSQPQLQALGQGQNARAGQSCGCSSALPFEIRLRAKTGYGSANWPKTSRNTIHPEHSPLLYNEFNFQLDGMTSMKVGLCACVHPSLGTWRLCMPKLSVLTASSSSSHGAVNASGSASGSASGMAALDRFVTGGQQSQHQSHRHAATRDAAEQVSVGPVRVLVEFTVQHHQRGSFTDPQLHWIKQPDFARNASSQVSTGYVPERVHLHLSGTHWKLAPELSFNPLTLTAGLSLGEVGSDVQQVCLAEANDRRVVTYWKGYLHDNHAQKLELRRDVVGTLMTSNEDQPNMNELAFQSAGHGSVVLVHGCMDGRGGERVLGVTLKFKVEVMRMRRARPEARRGQRVRHYELVDELAVLREAMAVTFQE